MITINYLFPCDIYTQSHGVLAVIVLSHTSPFFNVSLEMNIIYFLLDVGVHTYHVTSAQALGLIITYSSLLFKCLPHETSITLCISPCGKSCAIRRIFLNFYSKQINSKNA